MNFLQYAVWGAYLISMGSFLANAGLKENIWLFYAMQGIVSIFMPAVIGIIADRWIPAQKVMSICHTIAAISMISIGMYAMYNSSVISGSYVYSETFNYSVLFALYTLSVAFYMPTIALSNSVAFSGLEKYGKDPVKYFPPIRVFGTVGFICSMLAVNFLRDFNGISFQHTYYQFFTSGIIGIVLGIYSLTLPACPCNVKESKSLSETLGLTSFKLFKDRNFAIFFIFSMLLGASLQITNGYGNTYITSFKDIEEFKNTWGAENANALISLSQISETLCILLIPFFMKRFGIKKVMLISMFAWVFRFGFFGAGDTGSGLWMLIMSCIVYGVAFDFFNVSGSLYVNQKTDVGIRSSAQGLFMLMTNGLGASIGTWAAGMVVNKFVYENNAGNWATAWYIFAGYALIVGLLFMILFKENDKKISE